MRQEMIYIIAAYSLLWRVAVGTLAGAVVGYGGTIAIGIVWSEVTGPHAGGSDPAVPMIFLSMIVGPAVAVFGAICGFLWWMKG